MEFNGSLSGNDAEQIYKNLEIQVAEKLRSFGISDSLISRMMRTSSQNIDRIGPDELFEIIPNKEPWFEEWVLARCGTLTEQESGDYWIAKLERDLSDDGLNKQSKKFSDSYFRFLSNRKYEIDRCALESKLRRQQATFE